MRKLLRQLGCQCIRAVIVVETIEAASQLLCTHLWYHTLLHLPQHRPPAYGCTETMATPPGYEAQAAMSSSAAEWGGASARSRTLM
jgi:hypothetical protein